MNEFNARKEFDSWKELVRNCYKSEYSPLCCFSGWIAKVWIAFRLVKGFEKLEEGKRSDDNEEKDASNNI